MKRQRIQQGFTGSIGLAALAVAGCMTVGPDYKAPETAVPDAWTQDCGAAGQQPAASTNDISRWWTVFQDPVMTELVEQARVGNRDVRQAEARLLQARAQQRLATADYAPSVSASGSASRSRGSEETGGGRTTTSYANALDASWEIDLFGGKRRAVEAADATYASSQEDLRDVLVTLTAEVALNYVEYRSYQIRIAINETNVASQAETYAITRWRQEANLATQLDVDEARLSLEQTKAALPTLRGGLAQAEHQLSTLLGLPPGSLQDKLGEATAVPVAQDSLVLGIPADILNRRPDVRSAERKLAAQTAEIGVAEAARYPSLTLSGSIGLEALRAGNLYTVGARAVQGAVSAGWTLFDGGRLKQKVTVETALQKECLAAYEASVLTALQDVEDALTAYANEQERQQILKQAEAAGQSAFTLSREKYESGLVDFDTVLVNQRSLVSVQDSLASSRANVSKNLISLYKALGGGWAPSEDAKGNEENEQTGTRQEHEEPDNG